MGYFDAYKKRLKAETMIRAMELDAADNITREFKESPSYRLVTLVDENFNETPLDARMINVDKSVSKKNFHLLPETEVKVGQYIKIEDDYFLIEEFECNTLSPYAKTTLCNQVLKLVDGTTIPCIAEDESSGVKIVTTNDVILEADATVKVTIGDTLLSKNIRSDFRMIFGNSPHGIYKVGGASICKKGLIVLTCKKDKYIHGLDDLENNIAWQPDYDYENQVNASCSIEGSEKMLVGKEYVYVLDTNKNCDFAVDNENVEMVTLNMYTVTLKCDKPNEIFKLQASINDKVVAEKTIITIS